MASIIQFVDAISSSPGVRLDLNTPGTTNGFAVDVPGIDLSPPPIRRAVSSSLLTDGDYTAAGGFENRVVKLTVKLVRATTTDAAATAVQTLARELNRPTNLLKVQLDGATSPVFFHTYRASDYSLSMLRLLFTANTAVALELPAFPLAEGLLETPVSGATLATNPASANGHFLDVTGVKGDVETPALIRWPSSAVVANRESLFAVRRRGTPSSAPFLFQAEALTQGTDTTTQANDANFSGAGNNYSRCTFATAAMTTRLTLSDLGIAGIDLRGRYRVYARYRKNTAGNVITMQIQWGTSGGTVTTNDLFTTPAVATLCMADLGEIQVPRGWDPTTNFRDGVEVAASDTFHLAFRAQRVSGADTLDIDYLILVPADDRYAIAKWVEAGPDRWWLDAHDNSAHARNSSDQIATAAAPGISSGLPMLAPNQTNRVYMVYEVGSGLTTTLTTFAVTVSYFPRYLSIRPAAT